MCNRSQYVSHVEGAYQQCFIVVYVHVCVPVVLLHHGNKATFVMCVDTLLILYGPETAIILYMQEPGCVYSSI